MHLSAVSVVWIGFSMFKAAACNMCTSNFVVYIYESPVHAVRAACHTICCLPRKTWGSWVTALCSRNWKRFYIRELHLSEGTKHGCEGRAYLAWHWFMGCNVLLLHTKHRLQAGVEIRRGEAILYFLSPWEPAHPIRTRDKEVYVNTCFSIFPSALLSYLGRN